MPKPEHEFFRPDALPWQPEASLGRVAGSLATAGRRLTRKS